MAQSLNVMGDDLKHVIQVVAWFLLVTTVLGLIARMTAKLMTVRRADIDDYLIVISLVGGPSSFECGWESILRLTEFAVSRCWANHRSFHANRVRTRPACHYTGFIAAGR